MMSWIWFWNHSLSLPVCLFPFQRGLDPLATSWETSRSWGILLSAPGSFCWSGDDILLAPCLSHRPAWPIFRRPVCSFTYCEVDHQATKPHRGLLLHSGQWRNSRKKNKHTNTEEDAIIFYWVESLNSVSNPHFLPSPIITKVPLFHMWIIALFKVQDLSSCKVDNLPKAVSL